MKKKIREKFQEKKINPRLMVVGARPSIENLDYKSKISQGFVKNITKSN